MSPGEEIGLDLLFNSPHRWTGIPQRWAREQPTRHNTIQPHLRPCLVPIVVQTCGTTLHGTNTYLAQHGLARHGWHDSLVVPCRHYVPANRPRHDTIGTYPCRVVPLARPARRDRAGPGTKSQKHSKHSELKDNFKFLDKKIKYDQTHNKIYNPTKLMWKHDLRSLDQIHKHIK